MSKYIFCADLHIRNKPPQFRVEDLFLDDVILPKLSWIISESNKRGAIVLIAGDIWDSIKIGWEVFNKIVTVFLSCEKPIYVVPGQHDMSFHSKNLCNSPLRSLERAGAVTILDEEGINGIYGCSWGGDVDVLKVEKASDNILLIHKTITPEEPPFFLTDAVSADDILKQYPEFDYIVSGDYHVPHVTERDGRWLINCGSMVRQNKDQMSHEPRVYFLDTDNDTVEALFIPITESSKAFNLRAMELSEKSDFSEEMGELIESLTLADNEKPKFGVVLNKIIKEAKAPDPVKSIISDIMVSINGK